MSDFLAAAAAALNAPEELVLRSASAKAQALGGSADEYLAAWAGGEAVAPAAPAPTPTAEAAPAASSSPSPSPSSASAASPIIQPGPVEVVFETLPTPETVTVDEATEWEQVTTVASDDVRERPAAVIPRWLAAAFVIIPLLALSYLFMNTEGLTCGESGLLASDFEGNLANCDQSAYTPGGASGDAIVAAAFAEGQGLYSQCSSCHGGSGEGGVGPAFGDVVGTFAACSDHIEWVRLGSAGWPDSTYGDSGKAVAGGMPGFNQLSDDELKAISLYERVQFGGQDLAEAGTDCGIVEAEGETPAEDHAEDA